MLLLSNTTRNFLDKYQGKKKRFPFQPNSITVLIPSLQLGLPVSSPARSKTHQRGQKWNDETCHSSNLSILLTYDMIDFPSECSNMGLSSSLFFTVVTANAHSPALPGNGKKLTCRKTAEMNTDEIWKCNFPSVNQPLKVDPSHQAGRLEVRSPLSPAFQLMGHSASLIKIF